MIRRLIIFLIRSHLGLKELECFQFVNQYNKDDYYFFGKDRIWKVKWATSTNPVTVTSSVSLNWLMDDKCEINKLGVKYEWPMG